MKTITDTRRRHVIGQAELVAALGLAEHAELVAAEVSRTDDPMGQLVLITSEPADEE